MEHNISTNSSTPADVTRAGTGDFLLDSCSLLLKAECCDEFLLKFNFVDPECLKHAISKGIGYAIVALSTLVKVPQVLKILAAKSGTGISPIGVAFELLAITFTAAYSLRKGYPFSAWGEVPFLLVETALIILLVLWFDKKYIQALASLVAMVGVIILLCSSYTTTDVLWSLQALNLPLAVGGKMVQAYRNWVNGHTGQTSAITLWCLFLGCLARVFTSIQETGDQVIIMTFAAAAAANAILVLQVHLYWQATELFVAKEKAKKTK